MDVNKELNYCYIAIFFLVCIIVTCIILLFQQYDHVLELQAKAEILTNHIDTLYKD